MSGRQDPTPPSAGPGAAAPRNKPVQPCPLEKKPRYALKITVLTRKRDIPMRGLIVKVNGAQLGVTDQRGIVGPSELRDDPKLNIEVIYQNASARLRKEVFTLPVDGVSAPARSYSPGQCRNLIEKIVDVLGTGSAALPGDQDFDDKYPFKSGDGSFKDHPDGFNGLLELTVRMATLSLDNVPYGNQNAGSETVTIPNPAGSPGTVQSPVYSGSRLCMPTCAAMLLGYWDIGSTRRDIMQQCYHSSSITAHKNNVASAESPTPWQHWVTMRAGLQVLIDAAPGGDATLTVNATIPGGAATDPQSIPSAFADNAANRLALGEPMIVSVRHRVGGSHIILCRGAVVDHEGRTQWLIFNDPYGNMASANSVYGQLDIAAPVGLRGPSTAPVMNQRGDVEGVQSALSLTGHYTGPINGVCDETNPNDPTVRAIRAFQGAGGDGRIDPNGGTERRINQRLTQLETSGGQSPNYTSREGEINTASGADADRGRHVYYSGQTEGGTGGYLRLYPEERFVIVTRSPAYTVEEVSALLIPGQ